MSGLISGNPGYFLGFSSCRRASASAVHFEVSVQGGQGQSGCVRDLDERFARQQGG